MPAITSITDAAWPTSGTPTAGNSGFNTLTSSGTLVYAVDENGDKFISTTAANKSITVRIDATASVFAGGETAYQCELVTYPELTGVSGSAVVGAPSGFAFDIDDGTTRVVMTLGAVNTTATTGFVPSFAAIDAATVAGNISGYGREPMPVNAKTTVGVALDRTSKLGILLWNGVRIGGWTSTNVNHWSTSVIYTLPATPGIRWRVYATAARPARSWSGTDHTFTPDYTNYAASTDGLAKSFVHIDTDSGMGQFWTYDGTCTISEYASGGINPNRRRLVGGAGGVTATSTLSVGAPAYNMFGDYAFVTSLYVPSGGTWSFALRNAGDTADLIKLQVASAQLQNAAGTQLTASDATAVAVAVDKRYFLIVNVSSDGTAAWTLINATDAPTARVAWSNAISGGWTAQAIGKIVVTASETVECDRVDMGPWFTNAICDSLAAALIFGLAPAMACTSNNLAYYFPNTDMVAVPGIDYGCRAFGWPKESWLVTTAWPGYRRSQWSANVRAHMTYTCAMDIVAFDGGCYNDISNGTTAAGMIALVQADLDYCGTNRCRLVLMQTFERPLALSGSMTVANQIERRKYNTLLATFAQTNAGNPRLFYCDVSRAHPQPMTSTDGAHPTSNGEIAARAIATTRVSASAYANLVTSGSVGCGYGLSAGVRVGL